MNSNLIPQGVDIVNPVFIKDIPITKGVAPEYLLLRKRQRDEKVNLSIPVVKVYPNRIVCYREIIDRTWSRSLVGIQGTDEFGRDKPKNQGSGEISKNAGKRIMNAVNWMYFASKDKVTQKSGSYYKFRVNFITLTLPSAQVHDDRFIKAEMLGPLMEWARYNGASAYVWKAEPQKNGNIHFHITTNKFISYQLLRDKWNSICHKHGYINPYHEKFKNCTLDGYIQLLKAQGTQVEWKKAKRAWDKGTADNWMNPNSTDIHSAKKIRKMAAYMAKYMTKQSEVFVFDWVKDLKEADKHAHLKFRDKATDLYNEATGLTRVFVKRSIQGRQWFLSREVSRIQPETLCVDGGVEEQLDLLSKLKGTFVKVYDFASIIYYDVKTAFNSGISFIKQCLGETIFKYSAQINDGVMYEPPPPVEVPAVIREIVESEKQKIKRLKSNVLEFTF